MAHLLSIVWAKFSQRPDCNLTVDTVDSLKCSLTERKQADWRRIRHISKRLAGTGRSVAWNIGIKIIAKNLALLSRWKLKPGKLTMCK